MTTFDMTESIAPNSEQLDAVDLLTGPRIFTIKDVSKGKDDQPFNFHLAEFDRPWRPGKSMRRVLVACWGKDAKQYVGRRVELYCDPDVVFGGLKVGGIRVRALSHLELKPTEKRKLVPLLVSRGKSAMFAVDPLPDDVPTAEPELSPIEKLRAEWKTADPERRKDIEAEVAVLENEPGGDAA